MHGFVAFRIACQAHPSSSSVIDTLMPFGLGGEIVLVHHVSPMYMSKYPHSRLRGVEVNVARHGGDMYEQVTGIQGCLRYLRDR
jgi:hypothetical protein